MIHAYGTLTPRIHPTAFVHPTAVVVGDVTLGPYVSLWPYVVLRGDQGAITIGDDANVQDFTMIHATGGVSTTTIGRGVTIGHRVILHGCTVGDACLVGMGSIVLDNATVEDDCIVGAGALVAPNARIASGHLAVGSPARVVRSLNERDRAMIAHGRVAYLEMAAEHRRALG